MINEPAQIPDREWQINFKRNICDLIGMTFTLLIVLICFNISSFYFNSGMCKRHAPLMEQACMKDSTGSQMNFLSDLAEMET